MTDIWMIMGWPTLTLLVLGLGLGLHGVSVIGRGQSALALVLSAAALVGQAIALIPAVPGPDALWVGLSALLVLSILRQAGERHLVTAVIALQALSIVIISSSPVGLQQVLAGQHSSVLGVTAQDLFLSVPIAVVPLILWSTSWRRLRLVLFDPEQARGFGLKPQRWYILLDLITVVMLAIAVQQLGTITALGLLLLPTLLVGTWSRTLIMSVVLIVPSVCTAVLISVPLSWYGDMPQGHMTVCILAAIWLLLIAFGRILLYLRPSRATNKN